MRMAVRMRRKKMTNKCISKSCYERMNRYDPGYERLELTIFSISLHSCLSLLSSFGQEPYWSVLDFLKFVVCLRLF